MSWGSRLRSKVQRLDPLTRDVAIFCLAFVVLRAWTSGSTHAIAFPDTVTYMHLDFLGYGGDRLWTVPLLYTTLPNDGVRVFAQLVIGIVAWCSLAFAVARSLVNPLVARVGAALMLLLGLCVQVVQWDQILLSESLALSLSALLVAALLWVRLRPTRWPFAAMLAIVVLWVFTRQLQTIVFVIVAVCAIVWILLRRRRLIAVAATLALIGVWGGYAAAISGEPLVTASAHDLLVLRILKEPANAKFFEERGMPQMAVLRHEAATGTDLGVVDPVVQDAAWVEWVNAHWWRTYLAWLLSHPLEDVHHLLLDAPNQLSGNAAYAPVRPALPGPVQDLLWDRSAPSGDLPMLLMLALVLWLVSLRWPRTSSLDLFAAGLLGVALLWFFLGWHLEAVEPLRLLTPPALLLRMSLLILGLAALDRISSMRAASSDAT